MIAWNSLAVLGLVLAIGSGVVGCGDRGGGMVQENSEFTFDEIAAAAAAESAESAEPAE